MSEEGAVAEEAAPVVEESENINVEGELAEGGLLGEGEMETSGEFSEEIGELKQDIEDAIEEGATEEEVKEMIETFNLKVNGKTVTKSIDLNDKEAVRRELQLAAAGQSAMQSRAELEKAVQAEYAKLMRDPAFFLKDNGIDPQEFAEQYIEGLIEESKKSPEQLEKEQYMQELEAAREEARQLKEEKENSEFSRLQQQAAVQLDEEITEALSSVTTLPKSSAVVKRVADTMLWAMENGYEDVSAHDVLPIVEQEFLKELNELMDSAPEAMLETLVGKRNLDRLRKKRISAAAPKGANSIKAKAQPVQNEEKPKKPVKMKDFFRNL